MHGFMCKCDACVYEPLWKAFVTFSHRVCGCVGKGGWWGMGWDDASWGALWA